MWNDVLTSKAELAEKECFLGKAEEAQDGGVHSWS